MVHAKLPQPSQVIVGDVRVRLDFDCDLIVADDGVDLDAARETPIGERGIGIRIRVARN